MNNFRRPLALRIYLEVYEESQHDEELYYLQRGEILLPPEVLLDLGTQGGQEVVAVHHDVDAAVEELVCS